MTMIRDDLYNSTSYIIITMYEVSHTFQVLSLHRDIIGKVYHVISDDALLKIFKIPYIRKAIILPCMYTCTRITPFVNV